MEIPARQPAFVCADAYINEIGVSNRLFPLDLTTLCKKTKDLEDQPGDDGLSDIDRFARFIRATKIPLRIDAYCSSADTRLGKEIFSRIECDTYHVSSITTAPSRSIINGGTLTVPPAPGDKFIYPFSDFLLHDLAIGIVQNGGRETAYKIRTPPLWGLRLRSRLLHDGRALTYTEASLLYAAKEIQERHSGRIRRETSKGRECSPTAGGGYLSAERSIPLIVVSSRIETAVQGDRKESRSGRDP